MTNNNENGAANLVKAYIGGGEVDLNSLTEAELELLHRVAVEALLQAQSQRDRGETLELEAKLVADDKVKALETLLDLISAAYGIN